ncbi:MAG: helix-turn-helix domain-containing protein [Acidimicrobiales bacterium]
MEVIAMCSNLTRGFRRLLISSYPKTFSQFRGQMPLETASEAPRGQEIPYAPRRHLSPEQIEEIVAGYLDGTTARELGEKFDVHRTTVSEILKDRE